MRNGDKHGKFYKKLVRTLAMVYVFFVVLKRKPKYIAYFSAVILCPLLLIGLAIGSLKMLSVWNDDKTPDESTNQVEYFEEAANDVNEDDIDWQSLIDIDMKSIIAANPDVIGWLYFETEDTSYPILYTDEYDKNIKSKYNGVYTVGGTTLLEGKNSPNFADSMTVLYNHNKKDNTMSEWLKNYKSDQSYRDTHQYIQLASRNMATGKTIKWRYKIFTIHDVSMDSDLYSEPNLDYADKDYVIAISISSGNKRSVIGATRVAECLVD